MEEGFSQGAVCSPVIANLYLHYVLVWWLNEQVKPHMKGYGGLVVHADDFVASFQYRKEAEAFYKEKKWGTLGYNDMLKVYPIVPARIYVSVYD